MLISPVIYQPTERDSEWSALRSVCETSILQHYEVNQTESHKLNLTSRSPGNLKMELQPKKVPETWYACIWPIRWHHPNLPNKCKLSLKKAIHRIQTMAKRACSHRVKKVFDLCFMCGCTGGDWRVYRGVGWIKHGFSLPEPLISVNPSVTFVQGLTHWLVSPHRSPAKGLPALLRLLHLRHGAEWTHPGHEASAAPYRQPPAPRPKVRSLWDTAH